jgi:hypothetical protein
MRQNCLISFPRFWLPQLSRNQLGFLSRDPGKVTDVQATGIKRDLKMKNVVKMKDL